MNDFSLKALALSEDKLKHREVVYIDIANDAIAPKDYRREFDPALYKSKETKRGPLDKAWLAKVIFENVTTKPYSHVLFTLGETSHDML